MHMSIRFFFFFQAEDGIRDAQESRGLGDVYKRQGINAEYGGLTAETMGDTTCPVFRPSMAEFSGGFEKYVHSIWAESMKHGICKVVPPHGWWPASERPYGTDLTGRSHQSACLNDMEVPHPIKQCVAGTCGKYEYTLVEDRAMTLSEFRDKADDYLTRNRGKLPEDSTPADGERAFWRQLGPTKEPSMYGADMQGTLFRGRCGGWNMQCLDTSLMLLAGPNDNGLPGVTDPYLYVGMWAAAFAAHTEDMNLNSINYLHFGAPKSWYAIAPHNATRLEALYGSVFGDAARECPEFMRHKRYLGVGGKGEGKGCLLYTSPSPRDS
eukprot:TRINITY_DN4546_c0_g2_i1.p1 TRINITY_DN4546_c0_g2~~TRINITY_DN4546_c0_g2_i1.p1  ORF type:complete len:324 (-),score=68.45 TRINITY_DN4546_c0_g2_i1:116-1087(-)